MTDQLPPHLADHYEDPFHCGELEHCTHAGEAVHDACPEGRDVILVQLLIDDGVISEAWFDGEGCPWCLSTASYLTEQLEGQDTSSAIEIANAAASSELTPAAPPERQLCVTLFLRALSTALDSPLDEEEGPTFSGPHLGDEQ